MAAWRRFDRGVVLSHEGEAGGSAADVLMRGQVAVRAMTPDGDTATLNVIGPGAAFGELSLLARPTQRTATVQAIDRRRRSSSSGPTSSGCAAAIRALTG